MAHTTEIQGYTFTHNGDFSGDVDIVDTSRGPASWNNEPITIPFSVLADFVAQYIVGERIAALENAATLDVLLGRVK